MTLHVSPRCLAVGLALTLAGCNSSAGQKPLDLPSPPEPSGLKHSNARADGAPAAPRELHVDELPEDSDSPSTEQAPSVTPGATGAASPGVPPSTAAAPGELVVQRLVVASRVESREPTPLERGKASEPVVAFLEMKNLAEDEAGVLVTFEHESGKKVGFIELGVPGNSPRYRTWGRTHNIRDAGKWTAIVSSRNGKELAREDFEVISP